MAILDLIIALLFILANRVDSSISDHRVPIENVLLAVSNEEQVNDDYDSEQYIQFLNDIIETQICEGIETLSPIEAFDFAIFVLIDSGYQDYVPMSLEDRHALGIALIDKCLH